MNKIRILHTGDVHLKESGGEASTRAFTRIIELAQTEKVDVILIAGDLFDTSFANLSIKNYLASMFTQIPYIKVLLAAGNHDALPSYRDINFPSNVHLFGRTPEKVTVNGVDIYGVSLPSNYVEKSLLEGFKADNPANINLLVVHGDLFGNTPYNPFTADEISNSGIDYAALGHIHNGTSVSKIGNTAYAYCGVPQGRGFDEQGIKGIYIGDVYKGYVDLRFVKTSSYEFDEIDVDITGSNDYTQIINIIDRYTDKKNAYKIHLKGTFGGGFTINPEHIKALMTEYPRVKVLDDTGAKLDANLLAKEQSLRGAFVKHAMETEDNIALEYGLAALEGKILDVSVERR